MKLDAFLTPSQRQILERLETRDADERSRGERTPMSAMALAPAVAKLLFALVLQQRARHIVELGTSLGYSTIHLAAAADWTGGHVYSVDSVAAKTERARAHLEEAGLLERTTLSTADGAQWIRELPEQVDFVLIDCPLPALMPALEALCRRVVPSGMLFVDGGLPGHWDVGSGAELREQLEASSEWCVCVFPMHREQLLAVKLDTHLATASGPG